MEEEMSTYRFNSDLPSPSAGVGKLCKEPSRRFSVENFGSKGTAETYKASVNEFWEHSNSENYSPTSADKQIKLIIAKIKQKIRARLNLKFFQKLDESMTSIFCILNELHTKLKKQRIDATRNCRSGLKKMERVCKQIEFAMQEQTDMQRQQFNALQFDILEIKSMMQTMATIKYKTCPCFSSEKECTKYSVADSKSMKRYSSNQQIGNENRKNSGQEGTDIKDDEFLEGFLGFQEISMQEHRIHGIQQVAGHISPVESCGMDEILEVINENEISSLQKGGETRKQWNAMLTDNAETTMPCIHCDDGTNVQDYMVSNACPPEIWKGNIFLVNKKEFTPHLSVEEQNSKKSMNLRNCGSISNFLLPQTSRGSINDIDCNKENFQYNGLGTELSSSAEHYNRCDITEPSQAHECMNEFDKDIFRGEMGKDTDLMDILGNRLPESPVNKDKVLNSNTAEKQRSNTAEHAYAFKELYTEEQPSMKEKKTRLDDLHLSAKKNHCPSRKGVKCQASWLRRPSHRFNEFEVECLVCAVEKFGTGRWRDIKEMYFSTFKFRTATDLKDKWRSLLHSAMRFSINKNFRTTIPVNVLKRVYSVHVNGH
ncbi:hypothetical protein SUGI_0776240 [Cryptomeria japonica]|uniref:uncharacterized protein LOC131030073 n=1 Tax=Cryptomeria japonica TaxID=3369 RepID=UPI00241493BF|nr:uncharacterized protein LOC131030073 [Cryptomeria japonica]GLJ38129.1 hypothetical protein SUGI_0776240 [Cryptomeria japonica]